MLHFISLNMWRTFSFFCLRNDRKRVLSFTDMYSQIRFAIGSLASALGTNVNELKIKHAIAITKVDFII